jgi:hypothetical protein
MGTLSTVALAFAVPAILAITGLAVKSPRQYRRLLVPLGGLLVLAMTAAMAFRMGGDRAARALDPLIDDRKAAEARKAVEAALPDPFWLFILYFGLCFYLVALLILPFVLGIDSELGEKRQERIDGH